MTPGKRYVSELTSRDLDELAALTNLEAGFLVSIEKSAGKIVIGIDKKSLALALNGFYRNGGCQVNPFASATANECLTVSFDPPS